MANVNKVNVNGTLYNITDAGAVRFDGSQSLSAAQQTTARGNIGAGSDADVASIQTAIGAVPSGSNLQDEVDDLKSAFMQLDSHVIYQSAANRYNVADTIENFYLGSDGSLIAYNDWRISNFIYVADCENVICSGKYNSTRQTCTMNFFCTYNSKKQFIAQKSSSDRYAVESGVAYIRFCTKPSVWSEIMIEKGLQRSYTFIPYTLECVKFSPSELDNKFTVDRFIAPVENSFMPVWKDTNVEFTVTDKFISYAGAEAVYTNANHSGNIDVSNFPNNKIRFTGATWSGVPAIVFFTSENMLLTTYPTSSIAAGANYFKQIIDIPSEASYFIVNDIHNVGAFYAPVVEKTITYSNGKWYGKKWVCVGDSLTEVNIRTNKHYFDFVAEATGISIYNMGVGGTGYARGSENNNAFYQRISAVPNDADVITIFGSFNDLSAGLDLGTASDSGTATIGGCINTTINNLLVAFPLANFGIVAPCPWSWTNPGNPDAKGTKYCELLKEICYNRGIPFLDLYHNSLLRPWDATFKELCYSKDEGNGVHPDENGHKLIAPRFYGFLNSLII